MKYCNVCKETKELNQFHKNKNNSSGLTSACKHCRNRLRRESPVAKAYTQSYWKNADLLRKYRITQEQYNTLKLQQDNKCKICNTDSSQLDRNLAVDHCHITGRIRGLLCHHCNMALGLLKDSPDLLKIAVTYLS